MAQVSRQKIADEVWVKVWGRYVDLVAKQRSKKELDILMEGMLTKTERVMLAKRVVACMLLLAGWPVRAICSHLKMGFSTVYKYQVLLEKDKSYRELLKKKLNANLAYDKQKSKKPNFLLELLDDIWEGRHNRSRLYKF